MIEAKIIADSLSPSGSRLTTYVLTYPRFIHSEFMTHRMLSRNASSSRAIPVKRQIQEVRDNPVIPLAFTKNQRGMQGGEPLSEEAHKAAIAAWLSARDQACNHAEILADLEVHKQYANRILEPWAHITVVCTATDWDNFFALRIHKDAQPEIHKLSKEMWTAYQHSEPRQLNDGEWHMPFIDIYNEKDTESGTLNHGTLLKRSVARCARVSYKNHDGTDTTTDQDLALYSRLLTNVPIHASPAEHQAMAIGDPSVRSGNFRGFIQYRKTLKNENITEYLPYQNE